MSLNIAFIGLGAIVFLIYVPKLLNTNTLKGWFGSTVLLSRTIPLFLVVASIALVYFFQLQTLGIKTVGIFELAHW